MPILPQQPVRAPSGMDNTSGPETLDAARSPLLLNVLCDVKGTLRTNISYRKLLTDDFATPIDAVGYYYGNQPTFGTGGSGNSDDKILFVSAGKLYYMAPTQNAPVPLPGTGT